MSVRELRASGGGLQPLSDDTKAFDWLLPLLLAGYVFLDRGFAWWHLPGTPIFVSEIVLAFGLGGAVSAFVGPVMWRRSSAVFLLAALAGWGVVRLVPGLVDDPVTALRDAAIWLYLVMVFAVLAALVERPANLTRWLGWYRKMLLPMAIALPVVVFLAEQFDGFDVPDSDVPIFSYKPGNASVHLLAGIAFMWLVWNPEDASGRRKRALVTWVAVAGILILSTQGRGGFVAASVGGALLLFIGPERSRLVVTVAGSLLAIALAVVVVDPHINLGGRDISAEQLTRNVSSIVTGEGEGELGGNIQWRFEHWSRVWEGTNREVPLAGHGFGVNIAELYHIPQADIGLRNAHNSHLTLLSRMGWVGGIIWLLLWGFWYLETARAMRRLSTAGLHRVAGLAAWSMTAVTAIHVNAIFDPTLEGPQVSLWLWTFCALGIFVVLVGRQGVGGPTSTGPAVRVGELVDGAFLAGGRQENPDRAPSSAQS